MIQISDSWFCPEIFSSKQKTQKAKQGTFHTTSKEPRISKTNISKLLLKLLLNFLFPVFTICTIFKSGTGLPSSFTLNFSSLKNWKKTFIL